MLVYGIYAGFAVGFVFNLTSEATHVSDSDIFCEISELKSQLQRVRMYLCFCVRMFF